MYTTRPRSSVSSTGASSYESRSLVSPPLLLKSPTLNEILVISDDGLDYGSKSGGLPLQLVAVFVAEDDVHPGGNYVEGSLVVCLIIIRIPRRESASFERLTGNLMCHRSVTQPRPLDST